MNFSIIDGLAGEVLLLFLSKEEKNTNKALKLLDHIAENIFSCKDYSFNNGVVGFGWLVAFLHHRKYIDINSDEVLEDMDDQIYKVTLQQISRKEIEVDELLGLIDYHIIRHRNKNQNEQYYRKFIHQECFNLIVDRLIKYIVELMVGEELTKSQFDDYCKIVLKFSYSSHYIKNKSIEESIIRYIVFSFSFLEKNKSKINLYHQEINNLFFAMNNMKFQILIKEFEKITEYNFKDSYVDISTIASNLNILETNKIVYLISNIVV
ncbi:MULTISPECIES: hypothetical protein [Elizabethkingia]|uniref:hypothetical protein n=1 Tax=Elizabethkingia TaxID=308865 RepID=UPI00099ACB44|nr:MULTISPECIES: hypothetical protein [Elizabethkingia]MDX8569061.1 hypothetical protein [Elizabethkingia sp. HX XZB]MDX8571739.1 hypothetical protein [Elizabethkingia sp. HX QKY]OPC07846.1 hypothetical protein BAY01_15705 [Elizabethkingia miricola]OPC40696.1 hypothetical protein BAX99_02230 [Elizabethkingia miricola]